jgi:hypothetical protein
MAKKQVKVTPQTKRSYVPISVLAVILILGAGFLVYTAMSRNVAAPVEAAATIPVDVKDKEELNQKKMIDVIDVPDEGRGHSEDKQTYKSNPPTSGTHNPNDIEFGFYELAPDPEYYVHNLEHGDIEIHYSTRVKFSDKDMQTLRDLGKMTYKGSGVLIIANDKIDTPIVVTAWTKMLKLQAVDIKSIKQFMYYFMFEGPEKIYPRPDHHQH